MNLDIVTERRDVRVRTDSTFPLIAILSFAAIGFAVTAMARIDSRIDELPAAVSRSKTFFTCTLRTNQTICTAIAAFAAVIELV